MFKSFRKSWVCGIIGVALLALSTLTSGSALTCPSKMPRNSDSHTEWLARSLREIQSVKVGMTRRELLGVFTTEGGLSSRTIRKYIYRGSPYIKVDVEFERIGGSRDSRPESLDDKIIKISRPYLENPISD